MADWKTNLRTSLQAFSDNFITFRVRDGQAIPLLSPQQDLYLRENLKAKFRYRHPSDLQRATRDLHALLNMALEWSNDYFNRYDQQVKAFTHSLEQLAEQHIQLDTPQLIRSTATR
ncbi:uroporphyrinogen-III C-methyltransferase [Vibrio metschnikovii]